MVSVCDESRWTYSEGSLLATSELVRAIAKLTMYCNKVIDNDQYSHPEACVYSCTLWK